MKKIAVILLLLVYSFSSIGATIHYHYCMNELAGWSFLHSEDKECGKCGMKSKKDGCCKDEHKHIKLKAEHQKVATKYLELLEAPALLLPNIVLQYSHQVFFKAIHLSNAPPDISPQKIFILHCVFRI